MRKWVTLKSEEIEAVKHSVVQTRIFCRKPKSLKLKLDLFRELFIWYVVYSNLKKKIKIEA